MVSHGRSPSTITPINRRTALRAGAAAGAAGMSVAAGAGGSVRAIQDATPSRMRSEHLEVEFTPVNPVSITLAGGGPPQRGDHFYVDAAIYAAGDVNGTRIGTYQCFGVWTAADDVDAPTQRLTTVQFQFEDGVITGLVNEAGTTESGGAIQGGTGRFLGAIGTVKQLGVQPPGPEDAATPNVPGTPNPGQYVLRRSSTSCCLSAARRRPMRALAAELSWSTRSRVLMGPNERDRDRWSGRAGWPSSSMSACRIPTLGRLLGGAVSATRRLS